MTEFKREEFKKYPFADMVYGVIKSKHVVAKHTEDVLMKNILVKDFCEVARHFCFFNTTGPDIYASYVVNSQLKGEGRVGVQIASIIIYDSFMEYETSRMKELHGATKGSDIPNIN